MYGLEAISANNGWAMAITGPLIVISGLAILAVIISQMYKVVAFFNKKAPQSTAPPVKGKTAIKDEIVVPKIFPDSISETAEIYQPLIDKLTQPFELRDLYQVARQYNFPHPYLTVSRLRDADVLLSEGEGLFTWNK